MPITVTEALDEDTSEIITVERTAQGSYVDGIYQKGSVTTFKSVASVQQPTPEMIQTLESGERTKNPILVISQKELRASSEVNSTEADIVIYKGRRYKVLDVGDWSSYGHSTVIATRDVQ